ncbi:MAG: methyltransferase domain-containing protein [Acidobacteria bacterium]|nr:methyltransferase domain-containing protein [Acidobacteriota bacterium]
MSSKCPARVAVVVACALALAAPARQAAAQDGRAERHRVPAEFMSYLGAEWLERGSRIDEEQPERVLDAMGLRPGDVVADVGCGSGYFARRMARRVQPGGTVYCQDIQPEMLDIMRGHAAREGVRGIEAVLGTPTDPRLPAGAMDWIIIADVYHEMSDPEPMLAAIRKALAPGGRVALLEYRVEDGTGDQIKADHTMSVRQVLAEWQAGGFELEALHDFLPGQHLFFFRAADVPAGDARAPALTDHDLFGALDAGLVETEAVGAGASEVTVRIRRTGDAPIVVTSPVGTYFAAAGGARDMIARRDGWIVLDDGEWHDWTLRSVGRQPDRPAPAPGAPLRIRPPSTASHIEALLYAIQVGTYTVADSPILYPPRTQVVEEAAIWIADGDHDYATLAPDIAGPRIPAQYAAAFALVFLDEAGIDVRSRRIWRDRQEVFGVLRDRGLNVWYQLKTMRSRR